VALLISRSYPFIDSQWLVEYQARDSLLRMADGKFLLHLSSSNRPVDDERLIRIDRGAALIWINAAPDQAAGRFSRQRGGTRGRRGGAMLLGRAAPCSLDVLRAQPHDTVSAFTGRVN
jgi:hypothetical protein